MLLSVVSLPFNTNFKVRPKKREQRKAIKKQAAYLEVMRAHLMKPRKVVKFWNVVDPAGNYIEESGFSYRPGAINRAVHSILQPIPMSFGRFDPPEDEFFNGNSSEWRELFRKGYRCISVDIEEWKREQVRNAATSNGIPF